MELFGDKDERAAAHGRGEITVTPFRRGPADADCLSAEAVAQFTSASGAVTTARAVLFQLDDGRIGAAFYPDGDHGTVLRWDSGTGAGPVVIHWQAPHCPDDECGSPCGHGGTAPAGASR